MNTRRLLAGFALIGSMLFASGAVAQDYSDAWTPAQKDMYEKALTETYLKRMADRDSKAAYEEIMKRRNDSIQKYLCPEIIKQNKMRDDGVFGYIWAHYCYDG